MVGCELATVVVLSIQSGKAKAVAKKACVSDIYRQARAEGAVVVDLRKAKWSPLRDYARVLAR